MRLPLLLARVIDTGLPTWVGLLLVALVSAGIFVWLFLPGIRRAAQIEAEYQEPTEPVVIKVKVRGASPEVLARFARCWNHAFEMIAAHGTPSAAWPRDQLLQRLGPGNRVQVMPTSPWWSADALTKYRKKDVLAVATGPGGLVCRTAEGKQFEVPADRLATDSAVKNVGDQGELVTYGQLVGGELIAGVLRVGPNLDVLCHELIHRAEEVIDPSHFADNSHATWPARGLKAADDAYRVWLQKQA